MRKNSASSLKSKRNSADTCKWEVVPQRLMKLAGSRGGGYEHGVCGGPRNWSERSINHGTQLLNNIPSLVAENQLNTTQANLQKTLYQLASGSRLNSGADDAAGLSIANSLQANITALTQSQQNANDGVGQLQVADGALSQVTTLLNRAVTLATEAATGTVNGAQQTALNTEFTSIKTEIDSIGTDTTFNGTSVFTATASSIFMSD